MGSYAVHKTRKLKKKHIFYFKTEFDSTIRPFKIILLPSFSVFTDA